MRARLIKGSWLKQVAVVVGYVIAYTALRPFSDMLWASTAGLRLSCLLLAPYRYWPALCVGEFIPLADINFASAEQFGLTWAVLNSVPPMMLAMPLVWYGRERFALFPARRLVNVKTLLACVVIATLLWSVRDFAVTWFVVLPPGAPAFHLTATQFTQVVVGKYVGLLFFVPLALLIKLEPAAENGRARLSQMLGSTIWIDVGVLLLPSLIFLYWMSRHATTDTELLLRMAMFLPVAWMTIKHGWRAAAIGGTFAVIAISLMLVARPDADAFPIQAFLAFAMTCLFAAGVRVSALQRNHDQEQLDRRQSLYLAQQSFYRGELRLRGIADTLERTFGALHTTHESFVERFKPLLHSSEGRWYTRQLAMTQMQVAHLVNSIHPSTLRDGRLAEGLKETIGRTLDECGVAYHCSITGRDAQLLAADVQSAVYRLACDAVAYACNRPLCDRIELSLRVAQIRGGLWAVLRLDVIFDDERRVDRMRNLRVVASRLGATQFNLGAMSDHLSMFGGDLRVRPGANALRLTALLPDISPFEVREPVTAPAPRAFLVS